MLLCIHLFIHSFLCSVNKYLFSIFYILSTVLDPGYQIVSTENKVPDLLELTLVQWGAVTDISEGLGKNRMPSFHVTRKFNKTGGEMGKESSEMTKIRCKPKMRGAEMCKYSV